MPSAFATMETSDWSSLKTTVFGNSPLDQTIWIFREILPITVMINNFFKSDNDYTQTKALVFLRQLQSRLQVTFSLLRIYIIIVH